LPHSDGFRPFAPPEAAIRLRHDPAAQLRLFCLPHAGVGASIYHPWSRLLPPEIQICPVQLPGRENRIRERPATRLPDLIRGLADAVDPGLDLPFAIFGHSMGAAIGFELARELRRRNRGTPRRLVMSGGRAPHLPPRLTPLAGLQAGQFLEAVQERYGCFSSEILQAREMLDLVLPILRADLKLFETYQCTVEPPLDCPVSVFGGIEDATVTQDELADWSCHTTAGFDLCMLPGGHFFPQESRDEVLRALEARLTGSEHPGVRG
jgi:medium-chain acyl-[acyl-carrier-protein] hydrolase